MTDAQLHAFAEHIIGAVRGIVAEAVDKLGARMQTLEVNQTLLVEHVKGVTQRVTLAETRLDKAAE